LEENPALNLMFQLCGFIPVQMAANGSGNPNQYDKASFLNLLRKSKRAFQEGFDILVLPEGQLNPWPELGLLQVFPGAHKLSLTSHHPIRMVALHGFQNFWHADESILGMHVTARGGTVRAYSGDGRMFETSEEFMDTFRAVVGYFGANGVDHPDIVDWMDGTAWQEKQLKLAPLIPRGEEDTKHAHQIKENTKDKSMGEQGVNSQGSSDAMSSDVEQTIRAILELERQTRFLESESDPINPKRSPVGVHMCKRPSTRISLCP
jgi:1-acyl-sn-glycerol-3-phosphate acyltransferase